MSRATLCISVPQLDAVVNKIRDNERKRLKSPEIATRTAAHIPFIRHAVGEKARPAVADLQSKRRALQKNVAVENYRLRLNNVTSKPEAGARNAPGDELDRSRAEGAARYQP